MNAHALEIAALALVANPLTLFAVAATVLGALYLRFIKGTARAELVETLAKRTFNVVEDLKATGRLPPGTDKPVKALEILVPLLQAHGITMTSGIEDLARAIWGSMHAPDNAGPASTTEVKVGGFRPEVQIVEDNGGGKPSARRMGFLGAATIVALLLLPGTARAQTAPPKATAAAPVVQVLPQVAASDDPAPPAPSKFGGCVGPWTCFQPSAVVIPLSINLRTKTVEPGFQPGVGYGVTFHPGQWYSFGVDIYLNVGVAPQVAAIAVLGKAVNGYLRFGWSKGFIGDSNASSPRLLVGVGTDL